jgi:hypothetical protein
VGTWNLLVPKMMGTVMPNVERVTIESDERGFELHLLVDEDARSDDDGRLVLNIHAVAEELYDAVKREIGPWLYERDKARATYPGRLTDADREEEIRCAALGGEGPNAKQWRYEQNEGF